MTYVLFMCVWHVFTMIMYVYVHACLCYVPVYYIHVFVFIYVWTVEYIYTFIYVWVYIDQERVVLQRNEGSGFRVNSVSPDPLPALEAKAKEAKSWTINLRPWTLNPNQALNPEPQTLYYYPPNPTKANSPCCFRRPWKIQLRMACSEGSGVRTHCGVLRNPGRRVATNPNHNLVAEFISPRRCTLSVS